MVKRPPDGASASTFVPPNSRAVPGVPSAPARGTPAAVVPVTRGGVGLPLSHHIRYSAETYRRCGQSPGTASSSTKGLSPTYSGAGGPNRMAPSGGTVSAGAGETNGPTTVPGGVPGFTGAGGGPTNGGRSVGTRVGAFGVSSAWGGSWDVGRATGSGVWPATRGGWAGPG